MAVTYANGLWWSRGLSFPTEMEARQYDSGDPTRDAFTSGGAAHVALAPDVDPALLEAARRANRGSVAGFAPGANTRNPAVGGTDTSLSGNIGGAAGAYNSVSPAGRAAYDQMHRAGRESGYGGGGAFGDAVEGYFDGLFTGNPLNGIPDQIERGGYDPLISNGPTRNVAGAAQTRAELPVNLPAPTFGASAAAGTAAAPRADTAAADQQRQRQDAIITGLINEAGRQQAMPVVDSTGYNQTREQSNATYNALTALAGNNIGPITADTGQRNQSRSALLGTADRLTSNANNNIGPIVADSSQRNRSGGTLDSIIGDLRAQGRNDVADVMIETGRYDQGRDQTAQLIQMLIAEAQRPEGPSAAEALALTMQERAQRNAMGDASNLAGGWRSQLVNERRAAGLGAQLSAEAAAETAALRAREEAQYRLDVRDALGRAGALQSDSSARDLALGTSQADILTRIRQGNQTNARESLGLAQTGATNRLNSDTAFSTSNADRDADIAKANQLNALNSLLGAGNLQGTALTSDTSFATSNADRNAQIAQANQANSLAAQIAASNNAQQRLESDRALATDNANRVERVNAANADRAINALTQAGVISNGTRQIDAQLSQGDQRAIVEMAVAAAGADVQKYAAQLNYIIGIANVQQRQAELARLKAQDPTTFERIMGVVGQIPALAAML
jgi:hypothetical protein